MKNECSGCSSLSGRLPQMHNRLSPSAELRMIQRVRENFRMSGKHRMDGAAQGADTFAMNDAHLENSLLLAGDQIIRYQLPDLAGFESVQVQHAIDRKLDRFIHGDRLGGESWPVNRAGK